MPSRHSGARPQLHKVDVFPIAQQRGGIEERVLREVLCAAEARRAADAARVLARLRLPLRQRAPAWEIRGAAGAARARVDVGLEGGVELHHCNVQVTVTSTVKHLAQLMGEACAVVQIKLVA